MQHCSSVDMFGIVLLRLQRLWKTLWTSSKKKTMKIIKQEEYHKKEDDKPWISLIRTNCWIICSWSWSSKWIKLYFWFLCLFFTCFNFIYKKIFNRITIIIILTIIQLCFYHCYVLLRCCYNADGFQHKFLISLSSLWNSFCFLP